MNKTNALFTIEENTTTDSHYSKKINVPQYLPSEVCPPISGLCDITKYSKLLNHINNSNVSEEEKKLLRFAASRHISFSYSLIADYYAHASKEMQELMEESALVILDVDDAIANGYIKLTENLEKIMQLTGASTKDEK